MPQTKQKLGIYFNYTSVAVLRTCNELRGEAATCQCLSVVISFRACKHFSISMTRPGPTETSRQEASPNEQKIKILVTDALEMHAYSLYLCTIKLSKLTSLSGRVNNNLLYQTEKPVFLYRQKLNDQNVNINKYTNNNVKITKKKNSSKVLLAIDNKYVEYKEKNLLSSRNNNTTPCHYTVAFVAIQLTQLAPLGKPVAFHPARRHVERRIILSKRKYREKLLV